MKLKVISFILFIVFLTLFIIQNYHSNQIIAMDLSPTKINGLCGYVNKNNKIIIKPRYKKALPFCGNRALVQVCKNGNCYLQLINKKGKNLNKDKIYSGIEFMNGLEAAQINDQFGYINKCGDFIIKPQFAMATEFQEGLASVAIYDIDRRCNLWGYIDEQGQNKIPYQFFEAYPFVDDIAIVKTLTGYNLIDKNGKMLCKQNFLSDLPPLLQKNKRILKYKVNSDWVFGTNMEEIELDCNCNIIDKHKYKPTENNFNDNEVK